MNEKNDIIDKIIKVMNINILETKMDWTVFLSKFNQEDLANILQLTLVTRRNNDSNNK